MSGKRDIVCQVMTDMNENIDFVRRMGQTEDVDRGLVVLRLCLLLQYIFWAYYTHQQASGCHLGARSRTGIIPTTLSASTW